MSAPGGVSAPGGCLLPGGFLLPGGGVCSWGVCAPGVYLAQGVPGQVLPPCGQTHACKHITLPQTSFAGGNKMSVLNCARIIMFVM